MTVRKNFVFSEETAEHLKEISKKGKKSMTKVLEELIKEKYEEVSKEEKLNAFYSFAGSGTGLYGELTMQEIKANIDV